MKTHKNMKRAEKLAKVRANHRPYTGQEVTDDTPPKKARKRLQVTYKKFERPAASFNAITGRWEVAKKPMVNGKTPTRPVQKRRTPEVLVEITFKAGDDWSEVEHMLVYVAKRYGGSLGGSGMLLTKRLRDVDLLFKLEQAARNYVAFVKKHVVAKKLSITIITEL